MVRPAVRTKGPWSRILLSFAGLALAVAYRLAHAQTLGAAFEPATVLSSLRPAAQRQFAVAVHVDDLPRYDLSVTLDDGQQSFSVHQDLWFTNTERAALRELVFRVYGNVGASPGAAGVPPITLVNGRCVGTDCTVTADAPSVIAVRLGSPLAPGGHVRVAMDLHGVLPTIDPARTNMLTQGMESLATMSGGTTGGDYGVLSTSDGLASLAGFYPVLARRHGTQWERTDASTIGDLGSDDLANVHAVIVTAPDVRVVATGLTLRQTTTMPSPGVPSRQRVEVAAAAVREFALMAGPSLDVLEGQVGDITVRSWFAPTDHAAGARVLDTAVSALAVYTHRFGAYPYTELDLVEAPLVGGAGGVEFPGMVTVASMFYRDVAAGGGEGSLGALGALLGAVGGSGAGGTFTQMIPAMLEFVTAHEVAHQYWHVLVGSDSREHPFIDESLAQWSATLYLEDRYGPERAHHDADMQVKMNYQFMRMMGQPDGAVDRPAAAFGTSTAYAGLVYGKGPYLYNALRTALGDTVFFRGIQLYVETWGYGFAPPTGVEDAMSAVAPGRTVQIRALARRWLHETHGDADLGHADMNSVLGGLLGGQGANAPDIQNLIQQLAPMLQGAQGAQPPGGPPAGSPTPGQAPGLGMDPGALQQLLEQGLQGLGQ